MWKACDLGLHPSGNEDLLEGFQEAEQVGLLTETGNRRGRRAVRFVHAEAEMLWGYSHRHLQLCPIWCLWPN